MSFVWKECPNAAVIRDMRVAFFEKEKDRISN